MHEQLPPTTKQEIIVAADAYDTATSEGGWDSPERAQKLVAQYISKGSLVLDIGIGTGQAVKGYAEKGATIIGLDHDPEMLQSAQAITGESGYMKQADINGILPVADLDHNVDVVQAIGVLEFANNLDDIFDQIITTLKPGGVFVFTLEMATTETNEIEEFLEANITLHRHTVEEVKDIVGQKGLRVLYDESYGGYERGEPGSEKVPYHIFLVSNNLLGNTHD